jgi:hypothetical protein
MLKVTVDSYEHAKDCPFRNVLDQIGDITNESGLARIPFSGQGGEIDSPPDEFREFLSQ